MGILTARMSLYHMHICCLQKPEEAIRSHLELQKVVSHHVDNRNQTWDLWKNSQCLYQV